MFSLCYPFSAQVRLYFTHFNILVLTKSLSSVRVTAFTMRAILAGSDSAGTNSNLVVAQAVIYSVGFFGLLYSAYTLVVDRYVSQVFAPDTESDAGTLHREKMIPQQIQLPGILGRIRKLMSNNHLVRIVLTVAVALGVIGGVSWATVFMYFNV